MSVGVLGLTFISSGVVDMMLWLLTGEVLAVLAKSVCPALVTPELYITKRLIADYSLPVMQLSVSQCWYSEGSTPHVSLCS